MSKKLTIKDDEKRPSEMIWDLKELSKGNLKLIDAGNGKAKGTSWASFEHPGSEQPILFTGKQLFQLSKLTTAVKYTNGEISITDVKDFSIDEGIMHVG